MPSKEVVESQISTLKAAYRNVKAEQSNAKAERKTVDNAFDKIKKWKGGVYSFVKEQDLKGKYDDWIWKWGWSDDGSINGVMDRLNSEIGSKEGLLASIIAEIENLFN